MNKIQEKRKWILDKAIAKGWTCNIETGEVWSNTGKLINKVNKFGYINCGLEIDGKLFNFKPHQFIYYMATGIIGNIIDHLNGNKSDNRIINLEDGTHSENSQNSKKTKGYTWSKHAKKWKAHIWYNGVSKHLGLFNSESDARNAYLEAKKIFHPIKSVLFQNTRL